MVIVPEKMVLLQTPFHLITEKVSHEVRVYLKKKRLMKSQTTNVKILFTAQPQTVGFRRQLSLRRLQEFMRKRACQKQSPISTAFLNRFIDEGAGETRRKSLFSHSAAAGRRTKLSSAHVRHPKKCMRPAWEHGKILATSKNRSRPHNSSVLRILSTRTLYFFHIIQWAEILSLNQTLR